MGSLIGSDTVALLSIALDATTLRQQAIAHNIANAGTPGYKPVEVSFEQHLENARAMLAQGKSVPLSALAGVRPRLETARGAEDGAAAVALDMEMAKLSQTVSQHEQLLKVLSRHYSILNAAMSPQGGR
ncbi:MAG TPA: flagellar basal body protein [Paucimonas sp.]|nr:flagellar basal body protein [Paucimonas sp.]